MLLVGNAGKKMIYLDNSATTKQHPQVTKTMLSFMEDFFGNPGSLHTLGIQSEKALKEARTQVAQGFQCGPEELVFNSGGTEGNTTVLYGVAQGRKKRGNKIITTKVEHPAILENCKRLEAQGFKVAYLPVDRYCRVNLQDLRNELDQETILVSIMQVNNEVGTIMPLSEIGKIIKDFNKATGRDVLFHTDAVQGFGKLHPLEGNPDLVTVSAHKIHGPKGVGALYIRKGLTLPALIVGGGQERQLRSGTENIPGIAGFGVATKLAYENLRENLNSMEEQRAYLLKGLLEEIPDITVNSLVGKGVPENSKVSKTEETPGNFKLTKTEETPRNSSTNPAYSPSILNLSFLGVRGEVLLHALEEDNIYVSTGSACSSKKTGDSHVLSAMGMSKKEIESALRFSFSPMTTISDMDMVIDRIKVSVNRMRGVKFTKK